MNRPKAEQIAAELAKELNSPKVQEITTAAKKPLSAVEVAKLIDEGGRLVPKCEKHLKDINRLKEIKKLVAEYANDDLLNWEQQTYPGKNFEAHVSACAFEREITDMPGVMAALGTETFLKHATFALEKLDVLLPSAGLLFVKKEQTGARRVKIQPKQPKMKAAA